jgi:hypothetical protein
MNGYGPSSSPCGGDGGPQGFRARARGVEKRDLAARGARKDHGGGWAQGHARPAAEPGAGELGDGEPPAVERAHGIDGDADGTRAVCPREKLARLPVGKVPRRPARGDRSLKHDASHR